MFDFHMHSRVSFDGKASGLDMARAAAEKGLKAICFTDHMDYDPMDPEHVLSYHIEDYRREYDDLQIAGLTVCKGMEFGLLEDNQDVFARDRSLYPYDFIIGSVHFVDGLDPYFAEYWRNTTQENGELRYLEAILKCVKVQDDFDVLGHMTFISKCRFNPVKRPVLLSWHRELADEIFKVLIEKGKGIEMNTSGVDRCGVYLPDPEYLRRFHELGGEIVTVGSDAHNVDRVGKYCREGCEIVRDIFGYVCTFQNRKPVFHRIQD